MGFEFIGYTGVKDLFSNVLCSSVMILVCLWRQFKIVLTVALMTKKRCFQFVYCMPPSVIKASRSLFKMKYYIFLFVSCFLIWEICDFACFILHCSACWLVNKSCVIFSANHSLARAFLLTACIVFALWLVHTFFVDNSWKWRTYIRVLRLTSAHDFKMLIFSQIF